MKEDDVKKGKLYLVGTPIGNLEDMTLRAVKTLQTVDLIAAEDTRHTGKLLRHFQITTPQISYHQHNRLSRQGELISHLRQGVSIALVTDAGMPGISDPGYDLVVACIDENIEVIPIPGVTAGITALAVSGLPTDKFVFQGFLPSKSNRRKASLAQLSSETRTMIFYEAPHRLLDTLKDFALVFGAERTIVLARELTKLHEQLWRGTISQAIQLYQQTHQPKGEFTLVVGGASPAENLVPSDEDLKTQLQQLLAQGMTHSQASRYLAQTTSVSRRHIYQLALDLEVTSHQS